MADRDWNGESQRSRKQTVETQRRGEIELVVGHVRWLLSELTEIVIAPADVHRHRAQIRGGDRDAELSRVAGIVDDARKPHVVHPKLEGVERRDWAARTSAHGAHADDSHR